MEIKKQQRPPQDLHDIFLLLSTWAADHDGACPDLPGDANENFRVLFQSRLTDNERLFAIPGDGWCLPDKPDGNLGTAPGFSKALEPGEQSYAYVAGLDSASSSNLPLLFYQPGPTGGFQFWTSVSGSAKVQRWTGPDILSTQWGTDPEKIRLPAVPTR